MCNKRNCKSIAILKSVGVGRWVEDRKVKIDSCFGNLIYALNMNGTKTVGSCCGHGKYNMSIVHQSPNGKHWELLTGIEIPRKRRFYVKDKQGYYYIPEVVKNA